jgi:hypothetical protein
MLSTRSEFRAGFLSRDTSYEGKQPAKHVYRARVPGGWLIFTYPEMKGLYGVTFYPDPNHAWDGGTQPGGT